MFSTKVEVDSAVVSPIIKHLPDDGPCASETCRKLKDTCKYTDFYSVLITSSVQDSLLVT
jgi:hypothetical protein